MATNANVTELVINKVENQAVYDYMVANNLINDNELYLVGGDGGALLYTPQTLTDEQKEQARANIGAVATEDIVVATTDTNGLMTATDKAKLDGIAEGANNYVLSVASATELGGVKVGTNLTITDGILSAQDTIYNIVDFTTNGLMSSTDKIKLDGIETGANKITVDTALSVNSTNPVQNKVVAQAINNIPTTVFDFVILINISVN